MNKRIMLSAVFSLVFVAGGVALANAQTAEVYRTTTVVVTPSSSEMMSMQGNTQMHSPAELATMPVNGDALPAAERLGTDERPGVRVFQNGREYWDPENRGGVNPTRNLPSSRDITYR